MTKRELYLNPLFKEIPLDCQIGINLGIKADNFSVTTDPKDDYQFHQINGWLGHKQLALFE